MTLNTVTKWICREREGGERGGYTDRQTDRQIETGRRREKMWIFWTGRLIGEVGNKCVHMPSWGTYVMWKRKGIELKKGMCVCVCVCVCVCACGVCKGHLTSCSQRKLLPSLVWVLGGIKAHYAPFVKSIWSLWGFLHLLKLLCIRNSLWTDVVMNITTSVFFCCIFFCFLFFVRIYLLIYLFFRYLCLIHFTCELRWCFAVLSLSPSPSMRFYYYHHHHYQWFYIIISNIITDWIPLSV